MPVGEAGGAWPLLGHGPALYRRPLAFLESLPAHGRLVRIRMGPRPVVVVCDPELTDRMLREDQVYDKGGPLFEKARESMGNGLVTCPHADHRRQRRLCQPAFHPARLEGYAQVMAEQVGRVADGHGLAERAGHVRGRVLGAHDHHRAGALARELPRDGVAPGAEELGHVRDVLAGHHHRDHVTELTDHELDVREACLERLQGRVADRAGHRVAPGPFRMSEFSQGRIVGPGVGHVKRGRR